MTRSVLLTYEDGPQPSPDVGVPVVEAINVLLRADMKVPRPSPKVDVELFDAPR
jgi:hypothetical protein